MEIKRGIAVSVGVAIGPALVLAGAVMMCTLSGLITLRKVLTADPAELF